MSRPRVLLVGGGGREHALAVALLGIGPCTGASGVDTLLVAPGNAGIAALPRTQVVSVDTSDAAATAAFAVAERVDLVVVGPEAPLEAGLADKLAAAGIPCFGPSKAAAQLETSKKWSKEFMTRHGIPTASFRTFSSAADAEAHIRAQYTAAAAPPVVKASGLAAGKGVIVARDVEEAVQAAKDMLDGGAFGVAGREVVVEERLAGPELSLLAFTDGTRVAVMPPAQDHKRAHEFDRGLNTGGMGAFAPSSLLSGAQLDFLREHVLQRAVDGMRAEGIPFVGVLYAGIMLTERGPQVLEFNARFGDPETQVLLPLLKSDFFTVAHACATATLDPAAVEFHPGRCAATLVAAAEGYPGSYAKGAPITIDVAQLPSNAYVFHAGTAIDASGRIVTAGGRVLAATGWAASRHGALGTAYAALQAVRFPGMFYRRDIGGEYHRPRQGTSSLRVGVLGSTRGTDLAAVLTAIRTGALPNVEVVVVISNKADAGILEKAAAAGIRAEVVESAGKTREAFDAAAVAILNACEVDVVLLIGFMRILSRVFTDRYAWRMLNVHPSLLPDFAGGMDLAVHEAVLKAGRRFTGCTVHYVDERVDGGAILVQRACAVLRDDTPESLKARVQALEGDAFVEALRMLTDDAPIPLLDLLRRTDENWSAVANLLPASRIQREPPAASATPLTYADAGVDIDAGDNLVERIKPHAKSTARTGADAELGGFGALFDLRAAGYVDPLLVSSTDGVGTKLRIAQIANNHKTVGIDLVAMSVNDLVVQGAEPLLFLDYYATGHLNVSEAADVIAGIAEGCRQAGCALSGGETAEMPSMYAQGDYDLAGFAVGAVDRSNVLPLLSLEAPGDIVLGIASSGVHSNGFSLVRRIVEKYHVDWHAPPPYRSSAPRLCDDVLTPTKIYIKCLLPSIKAAGGSRVKAMAHITGGGLPDNIPRVIRDDLEVVLDALSWDIPPVFRWMQRLGSGVATAEMARTFNIGIGMVAIVAPDQAPAVKASIEAAGETVFQIGTLQKRRSPASPCVVLENLDAAFAR